MIQLLKERSRSEERFVLTKLHILPENAELIETT